MGRRKQQKYVDPDAHYFRYLLRLRSGGRSNMYGAIPYLVADFGVTREEAFRVVCRWIDLRAEGSEPATAERRAVRFDARSAGAPALAVPPVAATSAARAEQMSMVLDAPAAPARAEARASRRAGRARTVVRRKAGTGASRSATGPATKAAANAPARARTRATVKVPVKTASKSSPPSSARTPARAEARPTAQSTAKATPGLTPKPVAKASAKASAKPITKPSAKGSAKPMAKAPKRGPGPEARVSRKAVRGQQPKLAKSAKPVAAAA